MTFSDKIEEWIKEVEARPGSALTLMRLIANRLRELSERDEQLLAENIALQNGTRVEEYQKRIAHLEYQLDLLKRHVGAEGVTLPEIPAEPERTVSTSLLVYDGQGRILRIEIPADAGADGATDKRMLGRIAGKLSTDHEPPRLLAVPSNEEALLLFSSGRVGTLSVGDLPTVRAGSAWKWEQAALPDEPRPGETLACIIPFSRLPVSEYFVQVSRRGCVKKTLSSLAQSILGNQYLGKGTLGKSDQPFELALCGKGERLAFVTCEGRLLGLDVDDLSYTAEERIRLPATDFVVAAFTPRPDEALIFVTQNGKVLHRESGMLEPAKSPAARGQALISANRLEQGIRFIGAAVVRDGERLAALDASGAINVYDAGAVTGSGALGTGGLILSIGLVPAPGQNPAAA
ncbi:MAG: hypothetical protein ACOYY3_07825 [Chloroflexota bacterium]